MAATILDSIIGSGVTVLCYYTDTLLSCVDKFFAMSLHEMLLFLTASENISYTVIVSLMIVIFGAMINLLKEL